MLAVLRETWALLFGVLLLLLANGLQGTLLGVRGAMEGMGAGALSVVMSAYFMGFLIGARAAPALIRRVGHVRVFAALASLISAAFLLYAALPHAWAWFLLRLLVGFCYVGVYVVAESWLNDRATNETRGQALAAYVMTQLVGIVAAQGLLVLADPGGWTLFVLISALVSVSFTPILLSASPAPAFRATQPMSLGRLARASPLGAFAALMLGGLFAALFGMIGVYGVEAGFSVPQIATVAAAVYLGGMIMIWPVGWLSDRTDRRRLIVALCLVGLAGSVVAWASGFWGVVAAALAIGGAVNTLYSLVIAHANDFLAPEDMAAGSGGLLFLNGLGAVGGPLVLGVAMERFGASAYFVYTAALFAAVAAYGAWRMTRRPAPSAEATQPFAALTPATTVVAIAAARGRAPDARARSGARDAEARTGSDQDRLDGGLRQ